MAQKQSCIVADSSTKPVLFGRRERIVVNVLFGLSFGSGLGALFGALFRSLSSFRQ